MANEQKIVTIIEVVDKGEQVLKNHAAAATDASKAHDTLATKIKAYESLAKNAKTEAEKLDFAKKAKEARIEYEKLTGTLLRETGVVEGLRAEVNMLNAAYERANESERLLIRPRLDQSRQRLRDLTAEQPQAAAGNNMGILRAGAIGGAVGGIVAGAIGQGIELIKNFGDTVVNSTVQYEKFEAALKTSYGSTTEANAALAMLVDTAALTPSQLNEVTDAFIKLKNTGFEPTKEQLIQISDLAASQGKGLGQYTEAVIDAQNLSFERLREFGILASKNGDKVTFSFKGQKQTIDATSDSINKYLIDLGKMPGIAGTSEAVAKTLGGALSNLEDNFFKLGVALGKSSGVMKNVVTAASDLVAAFSDLVGSSPSEQIEQERLGFESLSFQVMAANEGTESRNELIRQMRAQYPDFLNFLSLETLGNEDLAKTLNIVNDLYAQRVTKQLFKENEKEALDDYNKSLANSSTQLNNLIKELRDISASSGVKFNPIDIVGAEGDASKLYSLVDKIVGGEALLNTRKAFAKNLVKYYIEAYTATEKAQKDFQDRANEAAQAGSAAEILNLEKLNEAIQISIDSNNKRLQADKDNQSIKDQIDTEVKQKRINDLKLRLLKEAATLEVAERKKIQAEIDKLEGKSQPQAATITDTERKAIENKAKARKDAYEKAYKDLSKELESQRNEIEKLQLPKGEGADAIRANIENQKKIELKAIDDKYNDLVKELKEKGIGKAQIDALAGQKTEIEKAINEKFKIKLEFDITKFNDAKKKLLDDVAAKDFEFKINVRINEIRADKNATIDDLIVANQLAKELASTKLESDLQARINELTKVFGEGSTELVAAVESINNEYSKLFDAETRKELEANARDAAELLTKVLANLQKESEGEKIKIDIDELNAIKALNGLYNEGIISKEEYERAKTEITKEYASIRLLEVQREIDAEIAALDKAIADAKNKGVDTSPLEGRRSELDKQKAQVGVDLSLPELEQSQYNRRIEAAQTYFDAIKSGYADMTTAVNSYLEATTGKTIEEYNRRIEAQTEAVDASKELLARGNAAAYEDEQKTLKKLQDARGKEVEKEKKIQAVIQIGNAAMSASYAALAIAKAIAVDPTGITTAPRIAAIIAAGAGGLAAIIALFASVKNATSAKEGKERVGVGESPIGKDATGTNEYLYRVHQDEQILKKEDADKFRGLGGVKFLRNFNPSQTPQIASLEIKEAKQRHDYLTSNGSGKSNDILELKAQTTLLSEHLSELQKQNEILLQGFWKLINTKFVDRYK